MNVLVLAPHPDDEVLGCGGSIARHASRGDRVHVAVMTRAIPEVASSQQVTTVREELRRAHAVLGVASTEFLDLPAPQLDTIPESHIASRIGAVVSALRPSVVYIPHFGDIHVDHSVTHRAALVACRPLSDSPVRRLVSYETLSETEWPVPLSEAFAPNVFVDISDFLEVKIAAMACYVSQLKEFPHPRSLDVMRALAQVRGATVGLKAAEAFNLVRDIETG